MTRTIMLNIHPPVSHQRCKHWPDWMSKCGEDINKWTLRMYIDVNIFMFYEQRNSKQQEYETKTKEFSQREELYNNVLI